MKNYFLLLAACIFLSKGFAQSLNKGDVIINANIGAPHLFKVITKAAVQTEVFKEGFDGKVEVSKIRGINPIAVKGEYGFDDWFALGLNYSFWTLKFEVKDYYNLQNQSFGPFLEDSVDIYKVNITSSSIGIRPVIHLPFDSYKNDVFFGLGLGITKNRLTIGFESTDIGRLANLVRKDVALDISLPGGVYFAPSIGYRHYINPFFGLNFELGYEKGAIIQGGLVFTFNVKGKIRQEQKEEKK